MRISKSLLTAAFIAMPAFFVSAGQVTLNVPQNADHLSCTVAGESRTLVDGENVIEGSTYSSIVLKGENPYLISSVINDATGFGDRLEGGKWQAYIYDTPSSYTVSVINIDESRTAEFTLNVDDPTKVSITLSGYGAGVVPTAGTNTVKFDPEVEKYLTITPAYGASIYKVLLNGEAAPMQGANRWYFELTPGAVVDVQTAFPDKDVTVNFTYSEKGFGSIEKALVNGVEVTDFNGETLNVKLGATLELVPSNDFKYTNFTKNGVYEYWGVLYGNYFSYSSTILDDVTYHIDATPREVRNVTVTVNNPDLFKFYLGTQTWNATPLPLEAGDNVIKVNDNIAGLCWEYVGMGYAKSITIDGVDNTTSTSCLNVTDGMKIVFDLAEITLDQQAVVWMDNREKISTNFRFASQNNKVQLDVKTGYSICDFAESQGPYNLTWYDYNTFEVGEAYLNNELIVPYYPEYSTPQNRNYYITLADLDVVKIFVEEAPVECVVAFSLNEGAEVNVVRDLIVPVKDLDEDLNCFKGTQVAISPADPKDSLNVHVNETKIEPNDAGEYVFTVDQPDNVVKVESLAAGVVAISSEAAANAVYDLAGRKINADLNNLPAGLYIVNGKKVIK